MEDIWAPQGASDHAAVVNAAAIASLFSQLRHAVFEGGRTHMQLAEAIGTSEEEVRSILAGREDLTLSDLEVVFAASHATLSVTVSPVERERPEPDRLRQVDLPEQKVRWQQPRSTGSPRLSPWLASR